jgi:phosphoribosylformylglycinamidine synthase
VAPIGFAVPGASVALVGEFAGSLGASELHKLWGMALPDGLAPIDLGSVAATHAVIREAVRAGTLSSAHDIAEGGLAVALAECCLAGGIGAQIGLTAADVAAGVAVPAGVTVPAATPDGAPGADTVDTWAVLFGEGAGGFLVSGPEDVLLALGETIAAKIIGTVGGDTLTISAPGCLIEVTVDEMTAANSTMAAMFA